MLRNRGRARQLPAKELGVLNWHREFWLLMVEHALSGALGPPDLSKLNGFDAPAFVQYTVTTPDLLRSFRKYNADRPYHRQVRSFGFMVMFQKADECEQSTMMRVIAPFNRNPAKAAKKAFDRDTGASVSPKQLKTYTQSLRTYYNHPEAKFLNGERGDRGPTHRRHIIAKSVVHIGKEANKLEIQLATGFDPEAQVEYHTDADNAERIALKRFGPARVAREAGLSRKHVSAVASGASAATWTAILKIEQAISSLSVTESSRSGETTQALDYLRTRCARIGLRQVACTLEISPGTLSRVVSGRRGISPTLARRIKLGFSSLK